MIKATLNLDVQAIVNEMVGRFDADILNVVDKMPSDVFYDADGEPMFDADDLSNTLNAHATSVLDELDGKELS